MLWKLLLILLGTCLRATLTAVHIMEVMILQAAPLMIRKLWLLGHIAVTTHIMLILWEDFHQGAVTREIHTITQGVKLMETVTSIYLRRKWVEYRFRK